MSDQLTGTVRTLFQGVIASFAVWVAKRFGVKLDVDALVIVLFPLVLTVTRDGIMWLERHVDYRFGWLFGVARVPHYKGSGLK